MTAGPATAAPSSAGGRTTTNGLVALQRESPAGDHTQTDVYTVLPDGTPNGSQVAFTRGTSTGDPGDIFIVTLAGHGVTRLSHAAAYDHQVAWAPAGHRLVFERDFGDRSAIFTVKPDGTDLRRLTTGSTST